MNYKKFYSPYSKDLTKTNLIFKNKKCSGIYLVKKNDKIIYIGHSQTQLYSTIYRHFQKYNDTWKQYRVFFEKNEVKVRVILTSPKRAVLLEAFLILKFKPELNKIKYENYLNKKKQDIEKMLKAEEEKQDDFWNKNLTIEAPF